MVCSFGEVFLPISAVGAAGRKLLPLLHDLLLHVRQGSLPDLRDRDLRLLRRLPRDLPSHRLQDIRLPVRPPDLRVPLLRVPRQQLRPGAPHQRHWLPVRTVVRVRGEWGDERRRPAHEQQDHDDRVRLVAQDTRAQRAQKTHGQMSIGVLIDVFLLILF